MSDYISREAVIKALCERSEPCFTESGEPTFKGDYIGAIASVPAADVAEVRQIRAFIDRLVAERDKYDLHSMRWEHYDCDRLLIERMLDEMDGGKEAQREGERE